MDLTSMTKEESVNMEREGWKELVWEAFNFLWVPLRWGCGWSTLHRRGQFNSSTRSFLHTAFISMKTGFLPSWLWVMAVWEPWQPCGWFWSSPGAAQALSTNLMSCLEAAVIVEKAQGRLPAPQSAPCMWDKHRREPATHSFWFSSLQPGRRDGLIASESPKA